MSQEYATFDSAFVGAQRTLGKLMAALRCGWHVMMTPPDGTHGYEVSLAAPKGDNVFHGEHPTDPLSALLIAVTKYDPTL